MKILTVTRTLKESILSKVTLAMSAKLEAAIRAEIGVDDGREMPEIPNIAWAVDRADL